MIDCEFTLLEPCARRQSACLTKMTQGCDFSIEIIWWRAVCTATDLMLNISLTMVKQKQAHELQREWLNSSRTEPVYGDEAHERLRSKLITLNSCQYIHLNAKLMEHDDSHEYEASLWIMIDCDLVFLEPRARQQSSWTTMKQAHDWLWTQYFRATCTATELMLKTSLKLMTQAHELQRNWLNSSFTDPRAREAHKRLYLESEGRLDCDRAH